MTDSDYNKMEEAIQSFIDGIKAKTGHDMMILWGVYMKEDEVNATGVTITENLGWDIATKLAVGSVGNLAQLFGEGFTEEDDNPWKQ